MTPYTDEMRERALAAVAAKRTGYFGAIPDEEAANAVLSAIEPQVRALLMVAHRAVYERTRDGMTCRCCGDTLKSKTHAKDCNYAALSHWRTP